MKNQTETTGELAIVAQMLNERSGIWEITDSRLKVLANSRDRLPDHHAKAVASMLEVAQSGERFWVKDVTFVQALAAIADTDGQPGLVDIRRGIARLRSGAAEDGVLGRPWVQKTISLLERLESSGADRRPGDSGDWEG